MDDYAILIERIKALNDEIDIAGSAIDSISVQLHFPEHLRNRISEEIMDNQRELPDLTRHVRYAKSIEQHRNCWRKFNSISNCYESSLGKSLNFIGGALLRASLERTSKHGIERDKGLDNIVDLYKIAGALVKELSTLTGNQWNLPIIPADEESFDELTEIIKMRFPEFAIWNIAVAGHECGHLLSMDPKKIPSGFLVALCSDLKEEFIGGYLSALSTDQKESDLSLCKENFISEYFADLFAIYALGPSYACTWILMRFDPTNEVSMDGIHPSDVERAYFFIEALKLIKRDKRCNYDYMVGPLDKIWRNCLKSVGNSEAPANADTIKACLDKLYGHIERLDKVRYRRWRNSCDLSGDISRIIKGDKDLALKYTLADVLNAAWICRIVKWGEDSSEARAISRVAVDLCLRKKDE